MDNTNVLIDGREVKCEGEKNLLEIVRKAGIDLPTFCYHSELSVYGACRLCMVEVEGRGLQPSCSTIPEPGMKIKTNTEEIRNMRKIIVELLLANGNHDCVTCRKSEHCQLQTLSRRLGIKEVRFKKKVEEKPVDNSAYSIVRDPSKCVLCGDCVRMCAEVQGIGAIDFAFRGSRCEVVPSFGKDLNKVECVNCGQCARVCPTGALVIKSEVESVWKDIHNPEKTVIAQIAPAVRVALGEEFGLKSGEAVTGRIVAALKMMGFDKVYDTSFTADLTVIEEGNEFIERAGKGEKLPQFTSCCPGWVKFAEQYYPEYLPNLSTCKSPQQMFGSVARETLPKMLNIRQQDLSVVSIMPCTAKKFEAKRPEFIKDKIADVDHVLTTRELARMIGECGIDFKNLTPESFDMPLGYKTGAGVIFGNSGGVTEAVLRYVAEKATGAAIEGYEFKTARGEDGIRELSVELNGRMYNLAVVHGLMNARKLLESVKKGGKKYDLVEVMACPGGCIGGAGQPCYKESDIRKDRTKGIYENDKMQQLHKSQENPYIKELYEKHGFNDQVKAHELLHTVYKNRKRTDSDGILVCGGKAPDALKIEVCFGTGCFIRGSQDMMKKIVAYLEEKGIKDRTEVRATFCFERCDRGPVVRVGRKVIEKGDLEGVIKEIESRLKAAV